MQVGYLPGQGFPATLRTVNSYGRPFTWGFESRSLRTRTGLNAPIHGLSLSKQPGDTGRTEPLLAVRPLPNGLTRKNDWLGRTHSELQPRECERTGAPPQAQDQKAWATRGMTKDPRTKAGAPLQTPGTDRGNTTPFR